MSTISDDPDWLGMAYFGPVDAPPPEGGGDTPDPDDEELDETPAGVVMMLGFDPALEWDDKVPGDGS